MHITTGLESGGAEMLLYQLVANTDRSRFAPSVLSLTSEGPLLGERIRAAGVPIQALGLPRGTVNPKMMGSLVRRIREAGPDIVQTWLYHADLLGGFASRLVSKAPIIWGVHNTEMHSEQVKRSTKAVIQINRRLSHTLPTRIVCCSDAAREAHAAMGYDAARMLTINNGFDTKEFTFEPEAREALRRDLGLPPGAPLIGLAARFDPQKDHENFVRAAGILHKTRPDVHFVLCGGNVTPENGKLREWIDREDVAGVTHLLGLRRDMAFVTSALDAATISSAYGEALPLVLGEAMACGIPFATTDLPGPVSVLGGLGWVAPIRDPRALSDAWREILEIPTARREEIAARGRARIIENFSLERMVQAYEALYEETADGLQ